jgi:predicted dienelactone hydrolase
MHRTGRTWPSPWLVSTLALGLACGTADDDGEAATEAGSGSTAAEEEGEGSGPGGTSAAATSGGPGGDATTSPGDTTAVGDSGEDSGGAGMLPPDPGAPGSGTWSPGMAQVMVDGTTIAVTLFIPDDAGPHPVLVLTHGFQLGPSNYQSYGEHLASWGYVVVTPQMPGTLFDAPTHVELRAYLVGILDWIETVAQVEAGPLLGRADASAIALAGHSMGGKISMLTATSDARVRAVFGIDPVDAAGGPGQGASPDYPSVAPELMPLVVVPIGLVGETTNATGGLGGACAPADDNFEQYFAAATSPAIEIEILGANHMSFLDDPNCGVACFACPAGTDDPAVTRGLTHAAMVAFLELHLRGDEAYRAWLVGAPMQAQADAGLLAFQSANGF